MKLIYTILIFLSFNANATIYYVDNAGSDAANGTTTESAWQTIAKVNSSSFSPGDQILFKKGGSWNERLNPPSSGNAENVITIGAYGTGVKPIITGLQTQAGFTNVGNVWTATATNSVPILNTVLIAGKLSGKARYPNSWYLTFYSDVRYRIVSANYSNGYLTGTPDYTGAEAVVRTAHWILDVVKISSQHIDTLNFASLLTYPPIYSNTGFFMQNLPLMLDSAGEWTFDSTTKVLKVYSVGSPSVQISTIDTLVYVHGKDYITFDGISFQGANKYAIKLDTVNHITIQNCSINYSGNLAISAKKTTYVIVQNDSIQNSLNGGIYLAEPTGPMPVPCNYSLVDNNYVKNTGILAGMGEGMDGKYQGIFTVGLSNVITNNRVDSTGYIGIVFNGQNTLVKNNYVTNFCFVKDDGAGIYSVVGGYYTANYNDNSIIRSNIVGNGWSAPITGSWDPVPSIAAGIYLDNFEKLITVDSNTVFNCYYGGIYFNQANNISVFDNTVVDSIGNCMHINNTAAYNLNIKRNVFYSQSSTHQVLARTYLDLAESIDSNYYLRPILETGKLKMVSTTYNLPAWVVATGYDTHSRSTPNGCTGDLPLFYYNPTLSDSTFSLIGGYVDAKGNYYNSNSVVIKPYQSKILFRSYTITGITRTRNYKRAVSL